MLWCLISNPNQSGGWQQPPTHAILNSFTTEQPMDTFDFAELEAEVFDWEDDMLIPAENDNNDAFFAEYINSNIDYWLLCLKNSFFLCFVKAKLVMKFSPFWTCFR